MPVILSLCYEVLPTMLSLHLIYHIMPMTITVLSYHAHAVVLLSQIVPMVLRLSISSSPWCLVHVIKSCPCC